MKFKEVKDNGKIFLGDLSGQTYKGHINLPREDIDSLEGCPKILLGDLTVNRNNIKTLKYAPIEVEGDFDCSENPLTSLEFAPKKIGGTFYCSGIRGMSDEDIKQEIIKHQIRANLYSLSAIFFAFTNIKGEFDNYTLDHNVKSKGFRTLLGLPK